jgi:hypothetical protein
MSSRAPHAVHTVFTVSAKDADHARKKSIVAAVDMSAVKTALGKAHAACVGLPYATAAPR